MISYTACMFSPFFVLLPYLPLPEMSLFLNLIWKLSNFLSFFCCYTTHFLSILFPSLFPFSLAPKLDLCFKNNFAAISSLFLIFLCYGSLSSEIVFHLLESHCDSLHKTLFLFFISLCKAFCTTFYGGCFYIIKLDSDCMGNEKTISSKLWGYWKHYK